MKKRRKKNINKQKHKTNGRTLDYNEIRIKSLFDKAYIRIIIHKFQVTYFYEI